MKRINWPLLRAEDIEVRIATCKEGKTSLLLYQNSRTAMNAFDEMFGELGWQCDYYDAGGQIYGRIGVYDEDKNQWIWKSDTGEESNISADKGFSSDVFKRVAVRWGYARELYSTPKIVIDSDNKYMKYSVKEIGYNEARQINHLVISNMNGQVVYTYPNNGTVQHVSTPKQETQKIFVIRETPTDNKQMLPKYAFAQVCNTKTVDELKAIWNSNPNWQNNINFKNTINNRKKALTSA